MNQEAWALPRSGNGRYIRFLPVRWSRNKGSMTLDISLKTIGPNGSSGTGSGNITQWSKFERSLRALKLFGLCLSLAFISVFVPGLHFILVPGFLLGGVIGSIVLFFKKEILSSGKVSCPVCKELQPIQNAKIDWPVAAICPVCSTTFYFQDASISDLISITTQS